MSQNFSANQFISVPVGHPQSLSQPAPSATSASVGALTTFPILQLLSETRMAKEPKTLDELFHDTLCSGRKRRLRIRLPLREACVQQALQKTLRGWETLIGRSLAQQG